MPHWWNGRHVCLRSTYLRVCRFESYMGYYEKDIYIAYKPFVLKVHLSEACTTIIDSYLVTGRKDMKEVLRVIRTDVEDDKALAIHKRSLSSMIKEWRVHNLLYSLGIKRDRTKSVDLNINQPWYVKAAYAILSPLYFHFS